MRPRLCLLVCLVTLVTAAKLEQGQKQDASLASQVALLRKELDLVRRELREQKVGTAETNERTTLDWAKTSLDEVHMEMKEMQRDINITALLNQIADLKKELKRAEVERADLAHVLRTHEARIDKLDAQLQRLKYENRQLKTNLADTNSKATALSREVKNQILQYSDKSYNEVNVDDHETHAHRIRHVNKMIHIQISRLAKAQEDSDATIRNLQTEVMDVERRVDRAEEPNWNLLMTQVDLLQIENKILKEHVKNLTEKIENVDKLHSSVLELREDLESIENKSDKTMPEFRKEISKLDVCMAQLTAQASYLKEDQEGLRQSVRAIAVSVSNTMDRLQIERNAITDLNDTVGALQRSSKQHYLRLNDHIRKEEKNHVFNDTVDLPELMDQVIDLEPLKDHYEELISELPRDCSQVDGHPGIYLINSGARPTSTWCVNRQTLLQRRTNGSVDFNRKMVSYSVGFGDADGEFWLGLDSMHRLTTGNCTGMRIDMVDIYDKVWYAQYDHFSVGDAAGGYRLRVGGFSGNASDAFAFHDNMMFSTIDMDRDVSKSHCAGNYEGGWWYSHCQHVNINGRYTLGLTWFDLKRNEWIAVASSEMRLFRRDCC